MPDMPQWLGCKSWKCFSGFKGLILDVKHRSASKAKEERHFDPTGILDGRTRVKGSAETSGQT